MQELHGRLFWRAVKRCDGDSDASVRGVGEGATRYHAGGDGELRFVKWLYGPTPPWAAKDLATVHRNRLAMCVCPFSEKPVLASTSS